MKRILPLVLSLFLLCSCSLIPPVATETPVPTSEGTDYPLAPTARPMATQEDWPDDGRFTLRYADTSALNPYTTGAETNRLLSSLLFEPLIRLSADFQAEAAIAVEWTTSDGGQTFEFSVRDNVLFSDGSSLTYWDLL